RMGHARMLRVRRSDGPNQHRSQSQNKSPVGIHDHETPKKERTHASEFKSPRLTNQRTVDTTRTKMKNQQKNCAEFLLRLKNQPTSPKMRMTGIAQYGRNRT